MACSSVQAVTPSLNKVEIFWTWYQHQFQFLYCLHLAGSAEQIVRRWPETEGYLGRQLLPQVLLYPTSSWCYMWVNLQLPGSHISCSLKWKACTFIFLPLHVTSMYIHFMSCCSSDGVLSCAILTSNNRIPMRWSSGTYMLCPQVIGPFSITYVWSHQTIYVLRIANVH